MLRSLVVSRSALCYVLAEVKQTHPLTVILLMIWWLLINGTLEVSITALGGQTLGLWKL